MKTKKKSSKQVERRDFLKMMSLTGVGGFVASKSAVASVLSPDEKSNVVIITDTNATDKTTKTVQADIVQKMVDTGIKTYTGIDDVGNAWKSIFPGITEKSIIGLKVNTLFATVNTGTHPQIAYAVANGLARMDFGGTKFPENNIIIFDFHVNYLTRQGYTLNKTSSGVRCFPTSEYASDSHNIGGVSVRLSKIITESIHYMVNIAYLKHHSLSGVSLCMKNHYGSIHNPSASPVMHEWFRFGSPYISAINALEPIRSKQKFCIIDALYGVTRNGPSGVPTVNPDKIVMGQDIVAVDSTGRELLKSMGITQSDIDSTTHIDIAGSTYLLGNNDPTNINVIDINTSAFTGVDDHLVDEDDGGVFRNSPNPFSADTEISFYLPATAYVQMKIYTYTGKPVASMLGKKLEKGLHSVHWDGLGSSGTDLPDGVYLCELKTGFNSRSILMQKFKK